MTTRREFLKVSAAGGLAFGFHLPAANAQNVAPEINAWVVVRPDDTVIIRYARSEMGQGSMTSAAQLVAEELECDWAQVRVEYADTNAHVRRKRAWGDMAAVGSRTIRQSQDYLRKAGAGAREMLLIAAAQGWNAPVAECPVFGGKLKSVDAAKIEGRRGVIKVLPMEDYVAVVADNWWRAKEALKELPIEWSFGAGESASSESILQFLRTGLDDASNVVVARRDGELEQGLAGAAKVLEAEYFTPYLAHATLEPMGCTAVVKDGRVDVWTSTQNAEASHATAAATAGVPLENVYVHRVQLGGGFGRRGGSQDFVRQGVQIAKAMGSTPVKLLWTREEDTQHDFYRPLSLVRIKAGLDASGNPVAWYSRISAPSIISTLLKLPLKEGIDPQAVVSFADQPYAIPNVRIEYAQRNPHVPDGFWRTVGHSQNPFMRESFVDELAKAAGKDPYEYRRGLLPTAAKEYGVLEATAKAARWAEPLPAGVHRGIAVTEAYGSYVAAVAELAVSDKNVVDIKRLVLGIDSGHVVNPDNVVAQMQGSAVFMLSAMFWGDITIKDGRVEQSNFHDYRMMRLREMPKVEVVLAPSGGFWGGIGEPGQAAIAPAICNALFAATGKRVRSLPLKSHGFEIA